MAEGMRGAASLAAALLALAVLGPPDAAAPASPGWPTHKDGDFTVIETPHYLLRTEHSAEFGQKIASQQEALYSELYRRMKDIKPVMGETRLDLVIYRTQEAYMRALGGSVTGSQGVFMPGKRLLAAWGAEDQLDRILDVLRHEGTHQFIERFIGPSCPIWLNEGMAVFYENGRMVDGKLEIGGVPAGELRVIKKALADGRAMPIDRMLNLTNREWVLNVNTGNADGHLQYCQAWSMVHFLAYGDKSKYRAAFQQYMYYVSRGQASWDAWTQAFGGDTAAFEKRWREYVLQLKPEGGTKGADGAAPPAEAAPKAPAGG